MSELEEFQRQTTEWFKRIEKLEEKDRIVAEITLFQYMEIWNMAENVRLIRDMIKKWERYNKSD